MYHVLCNYPDMIIKQLQAELKEKNRIIEELKNPPPRLQRMKLRWVLNDDTYRIAVVLEGGGVLQVKSVTNGGGEVLEGTERCVNGRYPLKKMLFASKEEWLASLPPGGEIIN